MERERYACRFNSFPRGERSASRTGCAGASSAGSGCLLARTHGHIAGHDDEADDNEVQKFVCFRIHLDGRRLVRVEKAAFRMVSARDGIPFCVQQLEITDV